MTDPTVTAEWRTTLARIAHGLDLDTGEGQIEFRHQANAALRAAASLETLQALALAVGAASEPYNEYDARQVIVRNWVAAATGRGTDRDIDAYTHCPVCRAPYRRLPARAESLYIVTNLCTDDDCGFYASALDEHGRAIIENPPTPEPIELTDDQVMVLVGAVPFLDMRTARKILHNVLAPIPVRDSRRERLARWARFDVAPAMRRGGWSAFYFAASRAHRGAARLSRRAAALQTALSEISIWASYGVDDGRDGRL